RPARPVLLLALAQPPADTSAPLHRHPEVCCARRNTSARGGIGPGHGPVRRPDDTSAPLRRRAVVRHGQRHTYPPAGTALLYAPVQRPCDTNAPLRPHLATLDRLFHTAWL